MAKVYEHLDALDRPLKLGDPVAATKSTTSLLVGRITSISEKQVRITPLGQPEFVEGWNGKLIRNCLSKLRYPKAVVLLESPEVLLYTMKTMGSKQR